MKKILLTVFVIILISVILFVWKYESTKNAPVCGGIAGKLCPAGYTCKGMRSYPDAQGTCIKD